MPKRVRVFRLQDGVPLGAPVPGRAPSSYSRRSTTRIVATKQVNGWTLFSLSCTAFVTLLAMVMMVPGVNADVGVRIYGWVWDQDPYAAGRFWWWWQEWIFFIAGSTAIMGELILVLALFRITRSCGTFLAGVFALLVTTVIIGILLLIPVTALHPLSQLGRIWAY